MSEKTKSIFSKNKEFLIEKLDEVSKNLNNINEQSNPLKKLEIINNAINEFVSFIKVSDKTIQIETDEIISILSLLIATSKNDNYYTNLD